MIIIQSVNPQTGIATALAEFQLRGDGVHATYHSPGFQKEMERRGVYTLASGKLRPSDGQKFLDALPVYYANSTCIRVVENNPGGHGRADDDAHEWAPPAGGGRVVQGAEGPAHDEGDGLYGKKKRRAAGPARPPVTTGQVAHGEPKQDEWSDAAREAAAAARKANAAGKSAALAQQSKEAHKAGKSAESPAEFKHAHDLHAAAGAAHAAHAQALHKEAKAAAINGDKPAAAHAKAGAAEAEKYAAGHAEAVKQIRGHVEKKAKEHDEHHGKPEGEHEGGEHEPGKNPFRDLLKLIIGTPKR